MGRAETMSFLFCKCWYVPYESSTKTVIRYPSPDCEFHGEPKLVLTHGWFLGLTREYAEQWELEGPRMTRGGAA